MNQQKPFDVDEKMTTAEKIVAIILIIAVLIGFGIVGGIDRMMTEEPNTEEVSE